MKHRRANRPPSRTPSRTRRGSVLAAVIVLLLLLEVALASLLMSGTSEQGVGVDRLNTVRAFYAAEAGTQMALREIMLGVDEDGDGVIGGISDDGDPTNDRAIGAATVHVTVARMAGATQVTSEGRCADATRVMQALVSD